MFLSKMADCDAEGAETQVWLDFARDCSYLSPDDHKWLATAYQELGRILNGMMAHPQKFAPR